MNCSFCMTGKQGFKRSLSSAEIINQILSVEYSDKLTNLVFMGMGEPFDNLDEVMRALSYIGMGFCMEPEANHRVYDRPFERHTSFSR